MQRPEGKQGCLGEQGASLIAREDITILATAVMKKDTYLVCQESYNSFGVEFTPEKEEQGEFIQEQLWASEVAMLLEPAWTVFTQVCPLIMCRFGNRVSFK